MWHYLIPLQARPLDCDPVPVDQKRTTKVAISLDGHIMSNLYVYTTVTQLTPAMSQK